MSSSAKVLLTVLYGLMVCPAIFSASASASASAPGKLSDPLDFLPVIGSLLLVIVAIIVLAVFYQRINLGPSGRGAIKLVTGLSLGTKQRIIVIEVNGQQHLIGVTPQQINHLLTLDEPINLAGSPLTPSLNFQKILERVSKKNG